MITRPSRWLSLALSAALLAACQLPGAPGTNADRGHTVSANAFGNAVISVNGREFRLRTDDDKPVTQLKVMAAGQTYDLKDGALHLPASALNHAKRFGKGFFTVLAQGYSPKPVYIGQVGDDIVLNHLKPLTIYPRMSVQGGTLEAPDRSVKVKIPPGMIAEPDTTVALSEYVPTITPEDEDAFFKERDSFLSGLTPKGAGLIAAGGGNYRVAGKSDCDESKGLPCALDEALGFLVTVNGALKQGKMTLLLDLTALLDDEDREDQDAKDDYRVLNHKSRAKGKGSSKSRAARQVLDVIHDMDAIYGEAWRKKLYDTYGVEILGSSYLSFPVSIGSDVVANGSAVATVEGLKLFGVKMEVTVISSTASVLPPLAALPDMVALLPSSFINSGGNLISNNSAALIANNSAGVVSNNGGTLISNNSGSVVSNNGGTLVGNVRVPFLPESSKFRAGFGLLAGLQEFDWPSEARVRAVDATGKGLTDWVGIDGRGQYKLSGVPAIAGLVFLECEASYLKLRTLAPQPKPNSLDTANISTTTTGVTSFVRDRLETGRYGLEDVSSRDGFGQDNETLRTTMSQQLAQQVVSVELKQAAEITANLLTNPASLAPPELKKITLKVIEMPDHPKAARGLAAVTGLPESAFAKNKETVLQRGFTFERGQLRIDAKGYGQALAEPPTYVQPEWDDAQQAWVFPNTAKKWRLLQDGTGSDAVPPAPEPTPTPTPTPPPAMLLPPDLPRGPVKLLYTVEVQRGSGEVAQYRFRFGANEYTVLQMGGQPLPLGVDLLVPHRVPGALLGNLWTYLGDLAP